MRGDVGEVPERVARFGSGSDGAKATMRSIVAVVSGRAEGLGSLQGEWDGNNSKTSSTEASPMQGSVESMDEIRVEVCSFSIFNQVDMQLVSNRRI